MRLTVAPRWIAFSIFTLSSTLNFLDRQVLAALAPQLMTQFDLSKGQYGDLLSAFSITYALSAPLLGWFIDVVGLTTGSAILVALWSLAGMSTGLAGGYMSLLLARGALGLVEGGSVPAVGKASALYLKPRERSIATAINQVGLTLGAVLAPLAGQWIATGHGWRWAFYATGALGFLWIPLWLFTARKIPPPPIPRTARISVSQLMSDRRFWLLLAANMAVMVIYSLWVNWTTVYLVSRHGLTQEAANQRLAWMPQIFGTAGGLFGAWLSLRWLKNSVVRARLNATLAGCVLALVTALIPLAPSPGWATAGICASFFACLIASVNIYAIPLDLFGPERAAFAVAGLTGSYGLLQTFFSPLTGRIVDHLGFTPVLEACAVLPLLGYLLLWLAARTE